VIFSIQRPKKNLHGQPFSLKKKSETSGLNMFSVSFRRHFSYANSGRHDGGSAYWQQLLLLMQLKKASQYSVCYITLTLKFCLMLRPSETTI